MAAGRRNRLFAAAAGALLLLAGCAGGARPDAPAPDELDAIEAALMQHIEVLASDAFRGRRPGTEGEAKTLRYLAREWQAAGLQSGTNDPANPWFAPVELLLSIPERSSLAFRGGGRSIALEPHEARVFTSGTRDLIEGAPVLYVGMGGDNLDRSELAGRVVIMEWDHRDRVEQREALLEGGAAAVLAVVNRAELIENAELRAKGAYRLDREAAALVDGFVTEVAMERVAGALRWSELAKAARAANFRPAPLDLTATIEAVSTQGKVRTHNLIARLRGKRPGSGAVLLLAHWDHFGICAKPPADDLICNGAVDNASGLAVLTELARRLAAGPQLDRDVYFLATTAEEWGLLGARAFARDPPIPLDTIVAAFNVDSIAVAPRGTPVAIMGAGMTGLDEAVARIIRASGREVADGALARTFVQRQDGWALLQRDVPALMVSSAFSEEAPLGEYTATRYHRPSDEAARVELGGAAQDLLLHLALVRHFADLERWPAPTQ